MKAKSAPIHIQGNFLYPDLLDQLDPKDSLLCLAKKIPWDFLEREFAGFYSEHGRPAKPIRLMAGLLILKQLENLSDERVVEEWRRNPYFQAFCGMRHFQWALPCEPSDLCHFRKRIGEKGAETIFKISIDIHGKKALEAEIVVDTTVQEKNITFPTDTKLRLKVIENCLKVAEIAKIKLRRSYKKEVNKHRDTIRFERTQNTKEKKFAVRRLKTIANILLRELQRKLPVETMRNMSEQFAIWNKAVNQKRNDKDKIYSLHEPNVFCIAKGKEHKKYEFGTKVVIAQTKTSGIIVGAINAMNEYDGHTLPSTLEQLARLLGRTPKKAYCDRGFRGREQIGNTKIVIPEKSKCEASQHYKREARKNFRRRNAVEATNSHLKYSCRMLRNYLKGQVGDTINILLSAAAFNLRKWMRATAFEAFIFFWSIFLYCIFQKRYTNGNRIYE